MAWCRNSYLRDIESAVKTVPTIAGWSAEDVPGKTLAVKFETSGLFAVAGGLGVNWVRKRRGVERSSLLEFVARLRVRLVAHAAIIVSELIKWFQIGRT
jgi:hypothetical protein